MSDDPPIRRRLPAREAEFVSEAARGIADPEALIGQMHARALGLSGEYVRDPMTVRTDVDHVREAVEEIVDAVNRNVWWLEENLGHPCTNQMFQALRGLVHVHDLLMHTLHHHD